ncbi:MAG: glycosyltransferase [Bacteroidia bacterium]|nr:glycosyltransferase [Bacteroidia bacterium]
MRILHVIPSLQLGGAEKLCLEICKELSKRPGIEIRLAILDNIIEHDISSVNFPIIFVDSVFIPSILGKSVVKLDGLEKLIEEFKPTVIHSHLFRAEISSRYHIHQGISYFSHSHDKMHQLKKPSIFGLFNKKKITLAFERNWINKQYVACNNHFITISEDTYLYIKENIPRSIRNQVYLLPNAVNTSNFQINNRQFNSKFPKNLISIGSIIPIKNHLFLLKVVQYLNSIGYEVNLQILGKGSLKDFIEEKAIEFGIQSKINIQSTTNLLPHLKIADVYVHSCKLEGFGLVFIEAGSAGLPIVTLDGKGNRDLIKNGINGFMLEQEDVVNFGNKIMEVLQSEETYSQFSENSKKIASGFDIIPYVTKLLDLYLKS